MWSQLLPSSIDNTYRGHWLALWLFGLVVAMKIAMGANSIINGYTVATTADGVPLGTYPQAAAQTIVALFAIWGLAQLVICTLCVLALLRYRSIVPFMLAVLTSEHLTRKVILHFIPVVRTGSPPAFYFNLGLLALMIVGLGLSVCTRRQAA